MSGRRRLPEMGGYAAQLRAVRERKAAEAARVAEIDAWKRRRDRAQVAALTASASPTGLSAAWLWSGGPVGRLGRARRLGYWYAANGYPLAEGRDRYAGDVFAAAAFVAGWESSRPIGSGARTAR